MSYVADAVHFNTGASLINAALACADNGLFSMSVWYKNPAASGGALANLVYRGDISGVGYNYFSLGPASNIRFQQEVGVGSDFQALNTLGPTAAIWHHVLFSTDTTTAPSRYQMLIDGVPVIPDVDEDDAPFTALFNGLDMYVGNDTLGNDLICDLCDLWIAPGVSLLNGSFIIPDATVLKFRTKPGIAGIPQDPTGFPSGGAVLLSGDATGFQVNQGSGGSFALTGSITNAADSPSTQVLVPTTKCMVFRGGDTSVSIPTDFDSFQVAHAIGGGQSGSFTQGGSGGNGASYANITTGLSHFSAVIPGDTLDIQVPNAATGDRVAGDDTWLKDLSGTIRLLAPGGGSATTAIGDLINVGGTALAPVGTNYDGSTLVIDVPFQVRPNQYTIGGTNVAAAVTNSGGGGGGGAGGPDGAGANSGDLTPLYYFVNDLFHTQSFYRGNLSIIAGGMGCAGGAANGGQPGGGTYSLAHGLLHWDGFPVIPGEGGDATTNGVQGGRPMPDIGDPNDGDGGLDGAGGGSGPNIAGTENGGGKGGDGQRWVDSVNNTITIGPGGGGGGASHYDGQNVLTLGQGGDGGAAGGGGGAGKTGAGDAGDGGPGGIAIFYLTPALNPPALVASRTRIWGTFPVLR